MYTVLAANISTARSQAPMSPRSQVSRAISRHTPEDPVIIRAPSTVTPARSKLNGVEADLTPTPSRQGSPGHDELNAAKLASFTSFEGQFTDSDPQERFKFAISSKSNHLDISWPTQYGKPLVGALVKVAQSLRDKQRDPSFFDFVVSHRLLLVVQSGCHFRMHRHSTSGIF